MPGKNIVVGYMRRRWRHKWEFAMVRVVNQDLRSRSNADRTLSTAFRGTVTYITNHKDIAPRSRNQSILAIARRGRLRVKENIAKLLHSAQPGWSFTHLGWKCVSKPALRVTTPSAPSKVVSGHFGDVAAAPPHARRGIRFPKSCSKYKKVRMCYTETQRQSGTRSGRGS